MAKGSLRLRVTDLRDEPVQGEIDVELEPMSGSAGGFRMKVSFANNRNREFIVDEIECAGGPGTRYIVRIGTRNFRVYSFFQRIEEQQITVANDTPIRLMLNPARVKTIDAPEFAALPPELQTFLESASMTAPSAEDQDLENLRGQALYDALGNFRKAALLNIFRKASHGTTAQCFRLLQSPVILRQDRCFCEVETGMAGLLRKSEVFRSAPAALHKPLKGYILEDSFKSRDSHANLQVTLMRNTAKGTLAADVDIDESSGLEHGLEVIRNAVTQGRTNPYLIRELLLAFDPVERTLDPGYRFVF